MADELKDEKPTGTATEETSSGSASAAGASGASEASQRVPTEAAEAASAQTTTGEEQEETRIPKSRLDEVIAQREEERRRVERLEQELKEVRARQEQSSKPKTWEELSLTELEKVRDYYETQGDEKQVRFVDRLIVRREAREEVQRERQVVQRDSMKAQAWQASMAHAKDVVTRLNDPAFDLSNPDSKIRRLTVDILSQEPDLQNHPKGPSAAYEVALGRMLLERHTTGAVVKKAMKSAPTNGAGALDSGTRTSPSTSSLEREEQDAFNEPDPRARERKISSYLGKLEKARKPTK